MSEPASSIRVLHIDDEPDLAEMVSTFLERENGRIDVQTTTDPVEGMDILSEAEIDCVISDYDMPGIDGIELLERVREQSLRI